MSTLYITELNGGANVPGTLLNLIRAASPGDVISLSPSFCNSINYLDINGEEVNISKDLTIDPGDGRVICIKETVGTSNRLLRIVGASSAPVTVIIRGFWVKQWGSTSSSAGLIANNYADVTFERCLFGGLSSNGATTGIFAQNGLLSMSGCIVDCGDETSLNYYASSTTLDIKDTTFIGGVKSGFSGNHCVFLTQEEATALLPNRGAMNYAPLESAYYSDTRITAAPVDVYGNEIPVGGAAGGAGRFPVLTTRINGDYNDDDKKIHLTGATPPRRPVYVVGANAPVGFSTDKTIKLDSNPGTLLTFSGDVYAFINVSTSSDFRWYRSCFMALNIPVQTPEDMAAIIPNYKELFKAP